MNNLISKKLQTKYDSKVESNYYYIWIDALLNRNGFILDDVDLDIEDNNKVTQGHYSNENSNYKVVLDFDTHIEPKPYLSIYLKESDTNNYVSDFVINRWKEDKDNTIDVWGSNMWNTCNNIFDYLKVVLQLPTFTPIMIPYGPNLDLVYYASKLLNKVTKLEIESYTNCVVKSYTYEGKTYSFIITNKGVAYKVDEDTNDVLEFEGSSKKEVKQFMRTNIADLIIETTDFTKFQCTTNFPSGVINFKSKSRREGNTAAYLKDVEKVLKTEKPNESYKEFRERSLNSSLIATNKQVPNRLKGMVKALEKKKLLEQTVNNLSEKDNTKKTYEGIKTYLDNAYLKKVYVGSMDSANFIYSKNNKHFIHLHDDCFVVTNNCCFTGQEDLNNYSGYDKVRFYYFNINYSKSLIQIIESELGLVESTVESTEQSDLVIVDEANSRLGVLNWVKHIENTLDANFCTYGSNSNFYYCWYKERNSKYNIKLYKGEHSYLSFNEVNKALITITFDSDKTIQDFLASCDTYIKDKEIEELSKRRKDFSEYLLSNKTSYTYSVSYKHYSDHSLDSVPRLKLNDDKFTVTYKGVEVVCDYETKPEDNYKTVQGIIGLENGREQNNIAAVRTLVRSIFADLLPKLGFTVGDNYSYVNRKGSIDYKFVQATDSFIILVANNKDTKSIEYKDLPEVFDVKQYVKQLFINYFGDDLIFKNIK